MARICVPVCVRHPDEMPDAIADAARAGDIVELRADCLVDPQAMAEFLQKSARAPGQPLILTMRSPEQGGRADIASDARRRFWLSADDLPANSFIDLELDLVNEFSTAGPSARLPCDWDRVICSHHDFSGVPDNLENVFAQMLATPAGIIKIAVAATDATDCLAVFRLLDDARRAGRDTIAVGMGDAGVMTRILGPSRGSFLTYASLDEESGTAPGQLTATALREVYRIDHIDLDTQVFGIMGQPVGHSLSPRIHNAAFAASGINAVYIPFAVRDAVQFIRRMVHPKTRELDWKLAGLSVTAPHKSTVMAELDWIDNTAKEVGAVNTIVVAKDQQLRGYNTDAAGFIAPLRNAFGALKGARCAIIGAGGAARACSWALSEQGAEVTIVARDLKKAESLADRFGLKCQELSGLAYRDFEIVVNATPLGTRGRLENATPATADQLRGVRLAYDLVYNPIETRFLSAARAAGCDVLGGIEMLLAQAVEQFELWTGGKPDLEVMRSAALRTLSH